MITENVLHYVSKNGTLFVFVITWSNVNRFLSYCKNKKGVVFWDTLWLFICTLELLLFTYLMNYLLLYVLSQLHTARKTRQNIGRRSDWDDIVICLVLSGDVEDRRKVENSPLRGFFSGAFGSDTCSWRLNYLPRDSYVWLSTDALTPAASNHSDAFTSDYRPISLNCNHWKLTLKLIFLPMFLSVQLVQNASPVYSITSCNVFSAYDRKWRQDQCVPLG